MKELKQIFMLMLVSVLSAGFASCGGDDDDDPTVTPSTPTPEVPSTPEVKDSHEYVDLGLPSGTLWATCNVGAEKPEDYGLYFAWGETKGYTSDTSDGRKFDWASYKWCNGSDSKMTKYSTSTSYWDSSLGTSPDQKIVLDAEDDAATVNWGSDWQIPSLDQIKELYNSSYTTTKGTTQNGVYGILITSKTNGNSVFLPAAGYRGDVSVYHVGSYGNYWSRSLYSKHSGSVCCFYFNSGIIEWRSNYRFFGQSVRPVRVQK